MSHVEADIELVPKRSDEETLQERLSDNAYQGILPSRYLSEGETQEDLFERVAKNIAIADAVYADETVEVSPSDVKPGHSSRHELIEEAFGIAAKQEDGNLLVRSPARGWIHVDECELTLELTEDNASKFAWDTVYPKAPESVQEQMDKYSAKYQNLMEYLSFIPNSPTLMNAGDELQMLSACFVLSPDDDLRQIHETMADAADIFQGGGGCGYAFWKLRPYGDSVGASGGIASGPITFMETFDRMCETIAQGGTRRGAQMGVMRISHPDVIEFIHSKNKVVSLAHALRLNDPDDYEYTTFKEAMNEAEELISEDGKVPKHLRNAVEGHLSNFNISVGVTDDFMDAVFNGEDYTLTNPRTDEPHIATEHTKEMYARYGLGEHVTVGEELTIPAEELWQRIVDGAHENGEPGVLYLERANKQHSFDVEEHPDHQMFASNPCGEQFLEEYEACNLGHINLSTVVKKNPVYSDGESGPTAQDFREWHAEKAAQGYDGEKTRPSHVSEFLSQAIDWDELNHRIEFGTRFLENVVTMNEFPIPEIEEKVREMRKVGLGIMGLGQMYMQLGVRYGSPVAQEVARQVMTHINHKSKEASHELADERGPFDEWEKSKFALPTEYPEWFEHHTGKDPENWEDGYPVRNHNTTTIAPTGTTGMVGNTSRGCEPIYNVAFFKNVSDDVQGDDKLVEFDDYFLRILEANEIDVQTVKDEARELMDAGNFDGPSDLSTVPDAIADIFVTASELSPKEHASVQCALQEGVDSSISKTVNAPNEASASDAREVFEYIYKNGGKGVTYYRDGTRNKQVLTTRDQNKSFSDEGDAIDVLAENENADPETLEGILNSTISLDEIQQLVTLREEGKLPEPEEPWYENGHYARKRQRPAVLHGSSQRISTGYGKVYVTINTDDMDRPFELFANIGHSGGFTNSFTEALSKVISTALRSGVDPEEIMQELTGTRSPKMTWDNGEKVHSIPDAIGTAMQRQLDGRVDSPSEPVTTETVDTKQPAANDGGVVTEDENTSMENTLIQNGESPECPDCGAMALAYSEGCKTCEACGWSEC